jgi:CheY-like chemotaxis protein
MMELVHRNLRILVVEDHADTAAALVNLLTEMGHEVTLAGTVAEALAADAREPIELVVSDIGLPDGSGDQLMRELVARHGLRGIAVSGLDMDEDRQRSLAAGFSLHLTKPVNVQALQEALAAAAAARH